MLEALALEGFLVKPGVLDRNGELPTQEKEEFGVVVQFSRVYDFRDADQAAPAHEWDGYHAPRGESRRLVGALVESSVLAHVLDDKGLLLLSDPARNALPDTKRHRCFQCVRYLPVVAQGHLELERVRLLAVEEDRTGLSLDNGLRLLHDERHEFAQFKSGCDEPRDFSHGPEIIDLPLEG